MKGKALAIVLCLLLAVLWVVSPLNSYRVLAQDGDAWLEETVPVETGAELKEVSTEDILRNAAIVNLDKFSLADFGPLQEGGFFNVRDYLNDGDYGRMVGELGYDPSLSWKAGDSITSLMSLGDLAEGSTVGNWSLSTVAGANGAEGAGQMTLGDYKLPFKGNLEDLIDAVPGAREFKLREVRPLFDWAKEKLGLDTRDIAEIGGLTLGEFSDKTEFGSLTFEGFDFSDYKVEEIPGLENARLSDFRAWEGAKIDDVPDLKNTPLREYMTTIGEYYERAKEYAGYLNQNWIPFARVDVVWGRKEGNQKSAGRSSVSGSNVEGYNVVCDTDSCPYIELTDYFGLNIPFLGVNGKAWFDGYHTPWVKGGTGMFTGLPEPTGRNPFGSFFKVVITNTDESDGRADLGINGRFCFWWGTEHCTPYVIGPVPFLPVREGGFIVLGIDALGDAGGGGINGGSGSIPSEWAEWAKKAAEVAPELYGKIQQYSAGASGKSERYGEPGEYDGGVNTAQPCETYQGVRLSALKKATADIESGGQPENGYYAVGDYANCGKGCTIRGGHGLGRYQFMTYRPEIVRIFNAKPGGKEILQRSYADAISKAELEAAIRKYFPPALQEQVKWRDMKTKLAGLRREGYSGDALIYRYACVHYGGNKNTCADYRNPTYAKDALANYKKYDPAEARKCQLNKQTTGVCTGRLIIPTSGPWKSGYGMRRHPIEGRWKLHAGVDISPPLGTPVRAADGGEVIFAAPNGSAGNEIKIRHCNGWVTRYLHLSQFSVKKGDKVTQGQKIGEVGSTGNSTGPHLHFEIRINGGSIDPEKHLPKIPGSPRP
jgi:murein DD-endopeptidase MepM/ murein hydrolase activator NlpD